MSNDSPLSPDRALLRQHRERAANDDAPAFLRAGIVAHVGIADDQGPIVIPMTYHFASSRRSHRGRQSV
jgi:nitroimidazol reductase NimA-like FMN-containing flavoprotein (pyridoxamine 5'-phosphate oxidase superfamily)